MSRAPEICGFAALGSAISRLSRVARVLFAPRQPGGIASEVADR